jgi:hypothetical protein
VALAKSVKELLRIFRVAQACLPSAKQQ